MMAIKICLGIVIWPGNVKPGVSDIRFCQIDMIASFAGMLKVNLPASSAPDSENHIDSWLNKGGKGREYLVLQNAANNLSILNGNWKFIAAGKGAAYNPNTKTETGNLGQDQLYDLSYDKGEKVNVLDKNLQVVAKLRAKLEQIKAIK